MKQLIAVLALSLAGCSQLATQNAQIADQAAVQVEYLLCKVMTVGEWSRLYGTDSGKAQAWQTLCTSSPTQNPATPPPVVTTTGTTTTSGTVTTVTKPAP